MFIINTKLILSTNLIYNFFKLEKEKYIQLDCNNSKLISAFINENSSFANNIIQLLNKNEQIKDLELFSKLCLLYFNGGIILNGNINVIDVNALMNLYNTYDLCTIKSCIKESVFDGIIISKKHNETIFSIINAYLNDYLNTSLNVLILNKMVENNCLLLNEKIVNDKALIYYNNDIIAEHFINNISIIEKLCYKKKYNLDNIKIGITINVPKDIKSFYSNGIHQNCLYLYELLKNAGYSVFLIISDDANSKIFEEIDFYNFDYLYLNNIFTYDFDLVFSMGFSFPEYIFKLLKNIGVKIVYYMCGNNYLIDTERILYDQHKNRKISYNSYDEKYTYDQIWIIPQMYKQNKHYCEVIHRTKAIQIPFIWSPMSIKFVSKILKIEESELLYKKKLGKIGIFEPNISVMKWCLPCVLIAENTYRMYKNINHVYITNLNKTKDSITNFNMDEFNNMCRNLDIFKDKKLSSEGRYVTLEMMYKCCDIALSHQWENPLNYLYFDLAWMGWPILHNAYLCKDVGYYYDDFDYTSASETLNNIILHHDSNKNEYLKKNREIINIYIPSNKDLQEKYKKLINNLF